MSSEMRQQPDGSGEDAPFGPMKSIAVPATFQGWCSLVSDILAPAEELSPFKLGQVKELISDIDHNTGLFVAPAFVVGQILFLLSFILYLALAIYSLAVDADAMADACATESWVWLYVLLVVAIPTGLGLLMGLIKTGLKIAHFKIPPALLSLPGAVCYIALGVLGILLWASMSPVCDTSYSSKYPLLFVIFKVQVFIMGIAAILGAITTIAQTSVLLAHFRDVPEQDLPGLRSNLNSGIGSSIESRKRYVESSKGVIDQLKAQLANTQAERDELRERRDAARQERGDMAFPETFGEFSSMVVHHLAPVEELSPFKLGQVQELVGTISKVRLACIYHLLRREACLLCASMPLDELTNQGSLSSHTEDVLGKEPLTRPLMSSTTGRRRRHRPLLCGRHSLVPAGLRCLPHHCHHRLGARQRGHGGRVCRRLLDLALRAARPGHPRVFGRCHGPAQGGSKHCGSQAQRGL